MTQVNYIVPMKLIYAAAVGLSLALSPVQAQETPKDEGLSLIEEGALLLLEGLMQDMEPAIKDLRGMAETLQPALRDFVMEMGPALAEILGQIDDISAYHLPEILPNGDIIIRRKTPQELKDEPGEEIEI